MDEYLRLNLINLFTFYLTVVFVLNTFRRLRQYRDIADLARSMPGRWPRTLKQIKQHWVMFFTWSTLRPAIIAISLIAIQMVCSRIIWPQALLTGGDLGAEWWMAPVVGLSGAAMLAVDLYFIIRVGKIDRRETEKYLDEAEHWLRSWKAPIVKIMTFGFINPRKIVGIEVRKAMEEGKGLLNRNLWLISLQAGVARTLWSELMDRLGGASGDWPVILAERRGVSRRKPPDCVAEIRGLTPPRLTKP